MSRRTYSDIACWVRLLLAIGLLWLLWPAWLGGSTSIIIVSGTSMEPTYQNGAVLVVRAGRPDPGDVIAFRVPGRDGQIVHRVVERRSDGTLLVRGDNRDTPDLPLPTDADVIGIPLVHLPHGEQLLRLATSPLVLGVGAGCWVIAHGLRKCLQAAPA